VRVVGLDLEDISRNLDDLFDLLPQATRRADGGQRSLRATIEWSDALLTEDERHLLRPMSVFAGGFDLAAIKEVCASDGQTAAKIADLTARLVEKSLLLKHDATGLYQLLETIRQYAGESSGHGAIDPLPVYSHEVAWDDAPTALAASPDKPIVERERLLTSPR
jgi:predicted ATPase